MSDDFETQGDYARIVLAGGYLGRNTLAVISTEKISVYEAQYYNRLELKRNHYPLLIEWCKDIKL